MVVEKKRASFLLLFCVIQATTRPDGKGLAGRVSFIKSWTFPISTIHASGRYLAGVREGKKERVKKVKRKKEFNTYS